MANETQKAQTNSTQDETTDKKQKKKSGFLQTVESDAKPVQAFITKFSNDWTMNLAAALAYNLLTAIFPIALAILAILGFVLGSLDPHARDSIATGLVKTLPNVISSKSVFETLTKQLSRVSGLFGIIALLLALFGGSRLFILMENVFGIIYHLRPRTLIKQNVMALSMLFLFVFLTPLMFVASAGPAFVISLLQKTPLNNIPGSGFIFGAGGIVSGLLVAFILFLAMYVVVPNQHISFKHSWLGAVIAAVLLQIYLQLFSLYVTKFLNGYGGQVGFAIILMTFFYYFALILLIGAEVNAFFSEKIKATPNDLVTMVHIMTSHLAPSKEAVKEQAPPSHKGAPPKDIRAKDRAEEPSGGEQGTESSQQPGQQMSSADSDGRYSHEDHEDAHPEKQQTPQTPYSKTGTVVSAAAGTALAFVVEMVRLRQRPRRKK
ncbi:MAG: YihY/virulence factor BrkB family protein [Ktedonobacteraceae bacterium]|nr:YihY/virulence factor BrkB family protein [Ktedonobacteraceae bacterium]